MSGQAQLAGKVALVLGAGSAGNMGQAIAARFAAAGARVMIAGRNDAELARFGGTIGASHHRCDITDRAQLDTLVARALAEAGRLDIAVNAAGLNQVKPFGAVTRQDLYDVIDVQFAGAFQFFQAVLPRLADHGSVIQISSVSATAFLADHAAYTATKAATDTLVRALALEFGCRGIRINSIAPGPTADTPMAQAAVRQPEAAARLRARIPLGRLGTAADIAEAALWLAGDHCFMTGEVLQANGGRSIPRLG